MNIEKESVKDVHLDLDKPSNSQYKKLELDRIDVVLNTKSKQFILSNGIIFAKIDIKINNPLALNYHYINSANLDEFIISISKYIAVVDQKLTSDDKKRLSATYENYVKHLIGNKSTMSQEIVDALIS
jgi:hypothetical protein